MVKMIVMDRIHRRVVFVRHGSYVYLPSFSCIATILSPQVHFFSFFQ